MNLGKSSLSRLGQVLSLIDPIDMKPHGLRLTQGQLDGGDINITISSNTRPAVLDNQRAGENNCEDSLGVQSPFKTRERPCGGPQGSKQETHGPHRADMGVIRKKTATRGGEGGVKYVCDVCSADITSTVCVTRVFPPPHSLVNKAESTNPA